ncbi:Uncharacterised protein [Mycobacteroides abscessus subsp. abscessus]|nr:Uncharacterised protein [Mycobacteroides abscessus subsp. abscessus]
MMPCTLLIPGMFNMALLIFARAIRSPELRIS